MTRIGDYELDVEIGSGTTGTVWKAHRRGPIAQVVALKRVRDQAGGGVGLEQIRREAAVLTGLDHPHIVRVLEVLEDSDGLALAMQYAPGGSLDALLAERVTLPAGELVAVVAPLAEALASAHRKGILHGDVKPANILFTSDGEPLLGDFGVARALGSSAEDQVTGSAAFVAPELVRGQPPGPAADVYSLAVVCHTALAGKVPFDGPTPQAVIDAADAGHHEALVPGPDVPKALAEVVELAMARDPGRRFGTAEDFAASLRSTVGPQKVRLPGVATSPWASRPDDATTATDTYGPRPPRPEPSRVGVVTRLARAGRRLLAGLLTPVARGLLRRKAVTAGLVGALTLVGLGVVVSSGGTEPDCPEVARPQVGPDAQLLVGDTDGDGCDSYGVYELRDFPDGQERMVATVTLEATDRYVLLGDPGDQLLLGDWFCEGIDTPALYRVSFGELQYFATWPAEDGEAYAPAHSQEVPADATAELLEGTGDADQDDCDRIRITSEEDTQGA